MTIHTKPKIDRAMAKILSAYVQRLSKQDLARIMDAHEECCRMSLNHSSSAQLDAQNSLDDTVLEAVSGMISYDLSVILRTTVKTIEELA
jgi:hypothetical protein